VHPLSFSREVLFDRSGPKTEQPWGRCIDSEFNARIFGYNPVWFSASHNGDRDR